MTPLAPASPAPRTIEGGRSDTDARRRVALIVVMVALHAPLAIAMRTVPMVSTLHALATVLLGMAYAATVRHVGKLSPVIAYICGAEVLWRMTNAGVFWEFGKYASVAVLSIGLLRVRWRNNRGLAIAYFALLLPSIALTLSAEDLARAREDLSFNLSGPLTLAICALFFSNARVGLEDVRRSFIALIAPVFGIATLSYVSTSAAENMHFVNASNFTASAGFGPNQVSAMLGLGVLFAVLLILESGAPWRLRALLLALSTLFAVFAALTFSRGGLILALLSAFIAAMYLLRGSRRTRITLVGIAMIVFALGRYVVEPRLEAFTGGKLAERYSNTGASGRDKFVEFELGVFVDNPVLGVGPGMLTPLREEEFGMFGAAHTEYSRVLAEHGLLGAMSLVVLVALSIRVVRRARTVEARAITVAMIAWCGLFLALYGMRLAAPAFAFGLACAVAHSSIRKPTP